MLIPVTFTAMAEIPDPEPTDPTPNGGMVYEDRGPVHIPGWYDFDILHNHSFLLDGHWHNLDLSSIVPEGACLVHLRFLICDPVVNKTCELRKRRTPEVPNSGNTVTFRTQAPQINMEADVWVPCDENRYIQYKADAGSWFQIGLVVRGWFKS